MKSYPSILSSNGQNFTDLKMYTWDKVDGSNLRFEWSKKSGWYKSGTRTRLFDETDEIFGPALPLFHKTLAEPLAKIARDSGWLSLVVYSEFYGPNSFAGVHAPEDEKELILFDVAANKQGLMGPKDFLKTFGHLNTPRYLGILHWTRGFIQEVRAGQIDGITFEGVVGKAGEKHKLVMRKAKTQAWVDAVRARYSPEEAEKMVNS